MKKITKTHQPQELRLWREANKSVNHSYRDLSGTNAHSSLKAKLLIEQGYLCAYTGKRIETQSCHIEHLKPQNCCEEWEDVEYRNVVACFPADGGDTSHGYGAPVKAGWWNESEFVSPLSEECERRFRFVWSGKIKADPEDNLAAQKTIDVIKLDSNELTKLRKSRIDAFFGFSTRSKPLSIADAQVALDNIDKKDTNGQLSEFCFVLKQLLPKYLAQGGASK